MVDVMTGRHRGPAVASRAWYAGRLGLSESGVAKCLGRLARPHASTSALVPDAPVFMISRRRGCKLTAERQVIPGVPYVELPEWSIGDDSTGPLVSALAWRLYALCMWKRCPQRGTLALARRELAQLIRVRPDSLPRLVRELTDAGLILTHARPGRETLILPLARRVTPAQAARLWEAVLTPEEQDTPVSDAQRCAEATEAAEAAGTMPPPPVEDLTSARSDEPPTCGQPAGPAPPMYTSPQPSPGTTPRPDTGTSTKDPHYEDPHYEDPARVRAAGPSGAATPGDPVSADYAEVWPEATGATLARAVLSDITARRQRERANRQPSRAIGKSGVWWDDPQQRERSLADAG
ncbi:hypothetical protein [Salinispora vitiensis]|uniref:hypothetical protein n=1 Tax=Salinispora vitiensis TaxID=999544 RepID=UPI0013A5BD21|nr:hypothetical protein [Salinispora vitiensis]